MKNTPVGVEILAKPHEYRGFPQDGNLKSQNTPVLYVGVTGAFHFQPLAGAEIDLAPNGAGAVSAQAASVRGGVQGAVQREGY